LRQAIANARHGASITFAPGLSGATITQRATQLTISKNLTIDASALDLPVTINANGVNTSHRVLQVTLGATVILDSLNLTGGKTADAIDGNDSDDGGGVHNAGTMTIRNATISGNATGLGAPFENIVPGWDPLDPDSPQPVFTFGNSGRGGGIYNTGTLTLQNTTVTGNSTSPGQEPLGGSSGDGAGIWNSGTLVIEQCTISDNQPGVGAGSGGGFYNRGSLLIENSSVINNSAGNGKSGFLGVGLGGDGGGGINTGDLTLRNVTISGNTTGLGGGTTSDPGASGGGGSGGGWHNSGTLTVENSTITNNAPADGGDGGGILNTSSGILTLENSIVAGNSFTNVRNDNGNLRMVSDNLISGDPMLAPLGFYGGPTQTRPPLPGSPALDSGSPTANTPATDQRGSPRITGEGLDIGSCELEVRLRAITGFVRTPSGIRLSINGFHPGLGIEYSPNLAQGSWIDLGNFYYDQDRAETIFVDPDPVRRQRPKGFYRTFLRTMP
jgi:hypothetical protein